jgi:hypothetical protein
VLPRALVHAGCARLPLLPLWLVLSCGSARSAPPGNVTTSSVSSAIPRAVAGSPGAAPFASAPASSNATASDSPTRPPHDGVVDVDELGAARSSHEARSAPPPAVVADERDFASNHEELPALQALPDFLSVNDVLALLPAEQREATRDGVRAQFRESQGEIVRGVYLDSEERHFLLWVDAHLEQYAATYDANGQVLDRRVFSRARPYLRDVIELETAAELARGLSRTELVVNRITTMSVCCLPSSLEVYALGRGGRLREVFAFERSHVDVGPGVRYEFANHFEFSDRRVSVSRIHPPEDLRWEFVYRPELGRYAATPETARRLRVQSSRKASDRVSH